MIGLHKVCVIALLAFAHFTVDAMAQGLPPAPAAIEQERNRILQQEEQRRREGERQFRKIEPPKQRIEPVVPEHAPEVPQAGSCIEVRSIQLEGVTILSGQRQDELFAGYLGHCLTLSDLNDVVRVVTNAYIELGYVTTRAFLQPQSLDNGELRVFVLEGQIEKLEIIDNEVLRSTQTTAFPSLAGAPLNLRDIEQGLDQIDRLPSYSSTVDLLPGEKAGGSIVRVTSEHDKRFRASLALNNSGSESTGRLQGEAMLAADDVLGLYDNWTISYGEDAEPNVPGRLTRSASIRGSLPLGYWTLRWSSSYFEYLSTIRGQVGSFETSGDQVTHNAEVERVVHRDGQGKTSLALGLSTKRSRNFVENILIDTSSRKLTIANLRASHSRVLAGGVGDISIDVQRGLKALGALKDRNPSSQTPRAQFTKVVVDSSYSRPLNLLSEHLRLDLRSQGQWSPDTLFSTEQLSLGGEFTVRGFRDESISGDIGAYVRSELSWRPRVPDLGFLSTAVGAVEFYAGADAGWIKDDPDNPLEGGHVAGAALGLRLVGGDYFFADLAYERALLRPSNFRHDYEQLRFRLGVRW